MGYRHQVISDTMVPRKEHLPKWFTTKYEGWIDFDRGFWASYSEGKRYGIFENLEKDVQQVIKEVKGIDSVRLVFFADESGEESPDLTHVTITADKITEIRAVEWVVMCF